MRLRSNEEISDALAAQDDVGFAQRVLCCRALSHCRYRRLSQRKFDAFLQPILIPVAIAAILAYLLDPVVTHLAARGFGRTKAVLTIFAIAFLGIVALCAWIVPLISVQSASLARKLPAFTERTRDRVVDLIYRYEHTFGLSSEGSGAPVLSTGSSRARRRFPCQAPHPRPRPARRPPAAK